MRLISDPGLGFAPMPGRLDFPGHSLTLIAKAKVALVPGGVARLLDEAPAIPTGDEPYAEDELGLGTPRYPSDFAYTKPGGDVTVVGHFHAPEQKPVRASEVAVGIDTKTTRLAVIGRRLFRGGGRLPIANEAEPFNRLELRWENAYGGAGHRFNPVGKGYVAPESLRQDARGPSTSPSRDFAREPLELPRIERPDVLFTHLDQVLEPVCFGPRSVTWPVRRDLIGKCDERWLKTRWPWFPEDFDPRFYMSALPALQQREYLRGDETLRFKNMHPALPSYETRLPNLQAVAVVQRLHADGSGNVGTEPIALHLDTLWVDMDAEVACLVWRGWVPCKDADASDILYAWAGLESRTAALSGARIAERGAQAIAAEEAQWKIEAAPVPEPEPSPEPEAKPAAPQDPELVALLAKLPKVAAGPTPVSLNAEQQAQLDAAESRVEAELAAEEKATDEEKAKNAPPPWTRERVRAERQALAGVDLSGLDLSGEDLSGLDLSHALLVGARLDGAKLTKANLTGASLEQASLTDADLSGAKLDGANLSGARGLRTKLDAASLANANLSESELGELALRSCDLSLTLAADASWPGASFEECKLDDANFERAQLEGARFTKSSLSGVRFVDAQLARSTFLECELKEADFERCVLVEARLSKSCLDDAMFESAQAKGMVLQASSVARLRAAGADFNFAQWLELTGKDLICEGASLADALLDRCHLVAADFSGVSLARTRISGCTLLGAKFGKADLSDAHLLGCDCFESTFEAARLLRCDGSGTSFFRAEFLDAEVADFYGQKRDLTGTKLEPAGG